MEDRIFDIVTDLLRDDISKNEAIDKLLILYNVSGSRFVSATCKGEKCSVCGENATNKLGEEIPYDDPNPNRHNLTAYVCREHFRMIVGRLG
jgi:hypothetical protein